MKSSKSSLFLIELIISILFFSLASAACIQLFVKAHLLDKKTRETNQIVMWTQNLSELWYAADGDLSALYEKLCTDYGITDSSIILEDDENRLFLYFDNQWELCDAGNQESITYQINLSTNGVSDNSHMKTAEIYFYTPNGDDTTVMYSRFLSQHTSPQRRYFYE